MPIPSEPVVFMKATTCISGPNDDTVQPKGSTKLDWEVELAIVIGTKAQYVSEEKALDYVAGYTIVNDVSERSFQLATSQWDKGKGCDTFGPIGPWLVTTDEITDPQTLDMWLDVNGERMQTGNTKTMIFSCAKIVSHCSPVHDADARRHHHHRHAARRGAGHEAEPALAEARRRGDPRHRGPGRAAPEDRRLARQVGSQQAGVCAARQ